MTTIVTRAGKGSPLTHTEVDTNFTNLNTAKLEAGAIALGSAATPSISFTGDTNTGIYSPGADQVAISTGGSNRLHITSAGLVGIGTSTFATNSKFAVQTGAGKLDICGDGASSVKIINGGGITFDSASGHYFHNGATELMRITAAGLVGIGNTGPSLRLDVAATGDDGIRFSTTGTNNSARLELSSGNGTTSGKYAYIQIRNNDTNAQGYAFGTFGDDRWVIRDTKANSERLCVDTSGRLLVGTSSVSGLAAAKTVVKETTAAAVQRLIGNTAGAGGDAQKITIVRSYPLVSLGTKLIIPFVSQNIYNLVTLCKVTGLRDLFNSDSPLPFEITFAAGHTTTLANVSSYGGQGNFASAAASGLNFEITFTTAYTSGIMVCIEYMTAEPTLSINVPNIAMN